MSRPLNTVSARSEREQQNDRAFELLSQSYDTQPNPLLLLEQRYLERMLPEISGKDILDAGCGTGRWLSQLSRMQPRMLNGIDASAAMLQVASEKNIPGVDLRRSSCEETPFPDRSFDLLLSSFVVSYIGDIARMATELDRIARRGCDLFLSDMHPETQDRLGWQRTFRCRTGEVGFEAFHHDLDEIRTIFQDLGWEIRAALQAEFNAPEREIFDAAGRLDRFHEAEGHPAIYILHLRKCAAVQSAVHQMPEAIVRGGRCTLGPRECTQASLLIARGRITQIFSDGVSSLNVTAPGTEIDLSGYLVMPGLVNAHDHLEFALFPRLANSLYPNASVWARDIQRTFEDVIVKHRSVPRDVRLWWGGLRNLLCGVTTVCHHGPREPELLREDFPIRVATNFGWSHSLTFGNDLRAAHSTRPEGHVFIVHACEGIDQEAWEELWELDRLEVLDEDAVIVHGLAIDDEGAALMKQRGASLVVCPSSNQFLFGTVPDMERFATIAQVALGSDSPLTADGDLLDEIRFATRLCRVSPRLAYRMVTEGPAAILRLSNAEGTIKVGGRADLIAIRDAACDAVDRLPSLSAADVEFVMIGGRVQLASEAIRERLPHAAKLGLEPLWIDGMVRWLRAPVHQLLREAELVLGNGCVQLGGKQLRVSRCVEVSHAL
jgi:cytosine/adenosine deaminase-related metal-dependent hydrolase/SAM-dependent methyltransferase